MESKPPLFEKGLSVRQRLKTSIDKASVDNRPYQQLAGMLSVAGLIITLLILVASVVVIPVAALMVSDKEPLVIPVEIIEAGQVATQMYILNSKDDGITFNEVTAYTTALLATIGTLIAVLSSYRPSSGMMFNPADFKLINDGFRNNQSTVISASKVDDEKENSP